MMLSSFRLCLVLATLVSTCLCSSRGLTPQTISRSSLKDLEQSQNELTESDMVFPTHPKRHLQSSENYCSDDQMFGCALSSIFDEDSGIYSDCGGLFTENDEAWCYSPTLEGNICCGDAEYCCDPKIGAFVGILVAFLAILIASIFACCFCCKCCCLYNKLHRNDEDAPAAVVVEQPVVVAASPTKKGGGL